MSTRIGRSEPYPRYWEYKGSPVLLLGGSVEDNLFQIPGLTEHLDLLRSVGGNYVRCTMSGRDGGNVWPFARVGEYYDLDRWNDEYWRRFQTFLELTAERDIIVQVEVWATFDFYRDCWDANPLNPKNNSNYTAKESELPLVLNTHPIDTESNFFWSVPAERNQEVVLRYQRRFVDKLLSHSLEFGHVLYCMDNETSVTAEWGKYWSEYIKAAAVAKGVGVETTEMWDPHELTHPMHAATFDHPETYSFVDISQNNHQVGQKHWDNMLAAMARVDDAPRPLTNVKVYGADGSPFAGDRDGIERFWRNVFGGCASARFHRPRGGLGLSDKSRPHIKSMRMLTDEINVFECQPHNDLLAEREENQAYCMARPGVEAAVFFTRPGELRLDTSAMQGELVVRWLDVPRSEWLPPQRVEAAQRLPLSTPLPDVQAVSVRRP